MFRASCPNATLGHERFTWLVSWQRRHEPQTASRGAFTVSTTDPVRPNPTPPAGSAAPTLQNVKAHDHPTPANPAQQFLRDAAVKAADLVHREIIRKGMESYDAAHLRGRSRLKDWETARRRCQEIKRETINHLDKYLLQFEQKVIAHGGHVFWA